MTFDDNVREALPLLDGRGAALAVIEGSGAVVPPVAADATLCVAGAAQPADYVAGFLGTYRLLLSDALVLTAVRAALRRTRRGARRHRGREGASSPASRWCRRCSGRGRRSPSAAAASPSSPRRPRPPRRSSRRRSPRTTAPRWCSCPATSPTAAGCPTAVDARGRRGRRVPHRDQGGGGGRRRRGRRRRRPRARVLRQRARGARRATWARPSTGWRRSPASASPPAPRTRGPGARDEGA